MTRVEAYHILWKLWCDVTPEQAEAISMAQNDLEFVDLMPKDVVAVVRCKDCRWITGAQGDFVYCGYWFNLVKPNGFCSYGERRSDDATD